MGIIIYKLIVVPDLYAKTEQCAMHNNECARRSRGGLISCRFTEFQTILSQKVMSCNNKLRKNNPAVVLGRAIKL